ncbi:MAG: succinate--CoA ligase subunit alpha [Desulfocucumaceae bacterium]
MAILINSGTRILIQGITGSQGSYHARLMLEGGSRVVAGVTPGHSGEKVHGIPVYDTVRDAVREQGAEASMILVPPFAVYDAALEAIENGLSLVVIITEHVPIHDAVKIKHLADSRKCMVIGPNTIGVISPGLCKIGILPEFLYKPGSVGLVSRSGTLSHEVASNLMEKGVGFSTCVGIGGDPVRGADFVDILRLFAGDPQTEAVIMIGEIGGIAEEKAAEYLKEGYPKPVYAFIAGRTAPPGRRMGHAGAIVEGNQGTVESKEKLLRDAGVRVLPGLDDLVDVVAHMVKS